MSRCTVFGAGRAVLTEDVVAGALDEINRAHPTWKARVRTEGKDSVTFEGSGVQQEFVDAFRKQFPRATVKDSDE